MVKSILISMTLLLCQTNCINIVQHHDLHHSTEETHSVTTEPKTNASVTYLLTYPITQNPYVTHEGEEENNEVEDKQEETLEIQLLNETTKPKEVRYKIEKVQEKHHCLRECMKNEEAKTCRYHFKVEWYYTMSKACYECPYNLSNCYKEDCIPVDGVKRPILVVNRQLPGPSIDVCLHDKVIIDVENLLTEESTSIHWHGHHQRGTQYMDGVPFITQCPIHPKTSFRYSFKADTPGTHFWHSHSAFQRGDGMFGPLIVRVPNDVQHDLYEHDLSEHVIVVNDWTHELGVAKFLAHHHSDGDNKPVTLLVNGKGRFQQYEDADGRRMYTPTAEFHVDKDTTYRFRIINAGFLNCPIEISFDNHTLVVISSDGSDIVPVEIDALVTYAGERFDVILETKQEVGNYWIKFRGLMDCDERFNSAFQVAVLRYNGAGYDEPAGTVDYDSARRTGLVLNDLNKGSNTNGSISIPELKSLRRTSRAKQQTEADYKFYLAYDFYPLDNPTYHDPDKYPFNGTEDKLFTPQINHISMKFPSFPLMLNQEKSKELELCNETTIDQHCYHEYCECHHILHVEYDSIVELILIDRGFTYDANHPFHLHGYQFQVLGMERLGNNVTEDQIKELDDKGLLRRNFDRPPLKDTVTVPDGGYTVLRWHATNPGYWLFHCHIEYHVELGMALVFKVGEEKMFPRIPKGFPTCNNYVPEWEEEEVKVNETKETWWKNSTSSTSANYFPDFDFVFILTILLALLS